MPSNNAVPQPVDKRVVTQINELHRPLTDHLSSLVSNSIKGFESGVLDAVACSLQLEHELAVAAAAYTVGMLQRAFEPEPEPELGHEPVPVVRSCRDLEERRQGRWGFRHSAQGVVEVVGHG